jgi:hypothetical protein
MNVRQTAILAGLILFAGHAIAQQDKAPLKGPSGNDNSVPGETRRFAGQGGDRKERAAQAPVRHPMFMKALDVLRGDADASVRLTDAQEEGIRKADADLRDKTQAFRTEHQAQIRDLMSKLTPEDRRRFAALAGMMGNDRADGRGQPQRRPAAGGQGKRPEGGEAGGQGKRPAAGGEGKRPEGRPARAPEGDGMMTDPAQSEAARDQLRALMETAPRPEDSHKAIFALLTDSQRPLVEKEIERLRTEMDKRAQEGGKQLDREAERAKRTLDKKDAPDGKSDAAGGKDITSIDDPRIPERARERLKNLPPEQQREALRRMRERLKQGQPK